MSSREGFSPRSRTWIKNSCATSVNTTKNPKPLNGSTSIQPVESLANQLLQLTSFCYLWILAPGKQKETKTCRSINPGPMPYAVVLHLYFCRQYFGRRHRSAMDQAVRFCGEHRL